jgi:drug/metabolite transporter (DMT)-like permease
MFLVFLLYALFAAVFVICKMGLLYAQPLFLVGSRMAMAGILMMAYQLIVDPKAFAFSRKALWLVFFLAFFNIYLTNACEAWGLQYLSSAKTCLIYSLSPFASALLSFFLFSETLSKRKWLGLCIGFIGFIPIALESAPVAELSDTFLSFSFPELAVTVAAFSSVYGWVLLKQLITEHSVAPMVANGLSMFIGGGLALSHSLFMEEWNPLPVLEYQPFLACAIALLFISNITCYNLYGYLLKKYTATFMSFAGFITPLFTALLGWLAFNETTSMNFYISMAIVFIGLLLFKQEELRAGEGVLVRTNA